jgi:hypothetical protein
MGGHKESVPVRDSALKLFPIAEIFLIQSKEDPTFWQILQYGITWTILKRHRIEDRSLAS